MSIRSQFDIIQTWHVLEQVSSLTVDEKAFVARLFGYRREHTHSSPEQPVSSEVYEDVQLPPVNRAEQKSAQVLPSPKLEPVPMLRMIDTRTFQQAPVEEMSKDVEPLQIQTQSPRPVYRPEASPQWTEAQIAPILYAILSKKIPTKTPDIPKLVKQIAQAKIIQVIPRRHRARMMQKVEVLIERYPEQAPMWSDANLISDWLLKWGPSGRVKLKYVDKSTFGQLHLDAEPKVVVSEYGVLEEFYTAKLIGIVLEFELIHHGIGEGTCVLFSCLIEEKLGKKNVRERIEAVLGEFRKEQIHTQRDVLVTELQAVLKQGKIDISLEDHKPKLWFVLPEAVIGRDIRRSLLLGCLKRIIQESLKNKPKQEIITQEIERLHMRLWLCDSLIAAPSFLRRSLEKWDGRASSWLFTMVPRGGAGAATFKGWGRVNGPRRSYLSIASLYRYAEQLTCLCSLAWQVEASLLRDFRGVLGRSEVEIELSAWRNAEVFAFGDFSVAEWVPESLRKYRRQLEVAALERTWFTPDILKRALEVLLFYREQIIQDGDKLRVHYWISQVFWNLEQARLRELAKSLPDDFSEVISNFFEKDNRKIANDNFLKSLGHKIGLESVKSRSRKDKFVDWWSYLKLSEPVTSWSEKSGVFFSLAGSLNAVNPSTTLTLSHGFRGVSFRTENSSPVAELQSGAPHVLLQTGSDRVQIEWTQSHLISDLRAWRNSGGFRVDVDWCDHSGRDAYGLWGAVNIKGVELKFRWIAPGTFWMGSPERDLDAFEREKPRHQVTLTHGYWLAETPSTQALWEIVTGDNPSRFKGPKRPVESISWHAIQDFLAAINKLVPNLNVDLPTEAQWEYACRAGTDTPRYGELKNIAWYKENSGDETHPVADNDPNPWGLHDILGNVNEWCRDGMRTYSKKPEEEIDPVGPMDKSSNRVLRAGSWSISAQRVRSAYRGSLGPGLNWSGCGFRLFRKGDMVLCRQPDVKLTTDYTEIQLEIYERPAWASYIARDNFGLYAEVEVSKVSAIPIHFRLRWIPPGEFLMGPDETESWMGANEHYVKLTKGYWMADTPCTQSLWAELMGKNPSRFSHLGQQHPVENVSWDEVQVFLRSLNDQVPGLNARLPTEAQWEYTHLAGRDISSYASHELDGFAWHKENSKGSTHSVGEKSPNAWGLYDTLGNVWEWCHDVHGLYEDISPSTINRPLIDPQGSIEKADSLRVLRGGDWQTHAHEFSVRAHRKSHDAWEGAGFRISAAGEK